jgi:hypothetical protein
VTVVAVLQLVHLLAKTSDILERGQAKQQQMISYICRGEGGHFRQYVCV